jgi:GT2 family glycosyltransferase
MGININRDFLLTILRTMSYKIALIIPVYNGLTHLKKTLPLIFQQIGKISEWDFKIIIADDNSSDGTCEWLNDNYPEIIVIRGNGSLWWSGATNKGINYILSRTEYKYAVLWNHDILCADNYFDTLVKSIKNYDSKTMIASKIFLLDKPDIIFNMGVYFNALTGKNTLVGYGKADAPEYSVPLSVDWTGGMGTLIPVEAFQTTGMFDEVNFPQYYGDADFFLRAKKMGYKLIVLPELKMWNDKSSSGLEHQTKWRFFFKSLSSIKSNHNLVIEYKFFRKHSVSFLFLFNFIYRQLKYTGSFLKQWLLSFFAKS